MNYKQGRYSKFIKPLVGFIDLIIINGATFIIPINLSNHYLFNFYISILWLIISVKNNFYEVHRHTKIIQITPLLIRQIIFYAIILYAYMGFFKQPDVGRLALAKYLLFITLLIWSFKFFTFFLLKKFRAILSGNGRKVIVVGKNTKTRQLINIFKDNPDYGYQFKANFSINDVDFSLDKCFNYIIENNIDEIYFSVAELSNKQINRLIDFSDNNLRTLKFIPDNKDIFSKNLKFEYYDYIPILSLRKITLHEPINSFVKRTFDLVFSTLVILFILSWLTPLIAFLIRIESKGPIFFKQVRHGLDGQEFNCLKFRSMAVNKNTDDLHVKKNDMRVTKVGKFIRKTSLDEMPQFYNVFSGDMSIVGPRPHMISLSEVYMQKADKYMVRHNVKPGITGLAQVSGYRGEVENDLDIINRVKYDIFYIENWSLLLDANIVIQTFLNIFKGDEKAY
ncbi:putative colanic acid biosynthesis UDP-glucose lipid carrier transferase [Mariniflexile fucanivorans]|uniref:Putative colanic acid biosynthesis UDP-glucose lipid carrier transferase n=1 Tax=Mariniflexile fucanivorans TaxID=264023 RepID=A0A4R1RSD8_9FLAO|nr:exopolysaccharide biosynthesis polyprenyl glycosylphosphotransferase [Mariniflexile fucanivorans]TCL69229.1 putative colanic acid biosynthesis UDP-glucose lipid carrier transferase [Mariniflexile fucanivorans]